MDAWFSKVEECLNDLNVLDAPDLSSRLWNADETGFCTSVASRSGCTG